MSAYRDYMLERSTRSLESARLLLDTDPLASVNRSYYACFYAATASLDTVGVRARTHAGVRRAFGEHFVTTGRVSRTVGRMLRDTARIRESSDYEAFSATDALAAADLLIDAEAFVAAVRRALMAP